MQRTIILKPPPFPSFLRAAAAAAAHCTNNSTGCAPPTAPLPSARPVLPPSLGPFPAVFASSRATCLTARSLYSIGRPSSPAGGGRLIFARKPISSSERNVKVASLSCSGQIPINVFACTYVCTLFEKCLGVIATSIDLLRSYPEPEDMRLIKRHFDIIAVQEKKTQAATPSLPTIGNKCGYWVSLLSFQCRRPIFP